MEFLRKIQQLELKKRLIIFWTLVIVLGAAFLFLWLEMTLKKFENMDTDAFLQIKKPNIDIPKIEMPDFTMPTIIPSDPSNPTDIN